MRTNRCRSLGLLLLVLPTLLERDAAAQVSRFFELSGEVNDGWFGRVKYVGDIDDDGFDDFMVGAPHEAIDADGNGTVDPDEFEQGAVYLYSGRHLGAPLRRWQGDASGENFGSEIERLGDLDGDGFEEIGVSAPSPSRASQHAYVRLLSGRHFRDASAPPSLGDLVDTTDRDSTPGPDGSQGDFGAAFTSAGDFDRDGAPEILVAGGGSYRWAVLFSGATRTPLFTWDVHPSGIRNGAMSTAVASFGRDVTGDGVIDLVIGNYAANDGAKIEAGAVSIYSGRTTTAHLVLRGHEHHDWFGGALEIVPDLSGDAAALPELLIGAPGTFGNDFGDLENGNYVQLRFGEALATVVTDLHGESIGVAPGAFFGSEIDTGEYLKRAGDGGSVRHELFVGARHHRGFRGRVGAFDFDPIANAWSLLFMLDGKARFDKLGRVSARGRISADGALPDQPDECDDLLLATGHIDIGPLLEAGRVWGLTSTAGIHAATTLFGTPWAGPIEDPALLPTIAVSSPPVLGSVVQVELGCALDPTAWGLLLIGLGVDATPDLPHLLVSDYTVVAFQQLDGHATVEVQIPADPALFTTEAYYYAQALFALPTIEGSIGYSARVDAVLGGGVW